VNGGSSPRFYDFDDGVPRLVKWHPSPHGQKACYNELVASRLGQLIGAPILRGTVVYVPDEIIPPEHRASGAKPGCHFAVTRMEGENFVPAQHYAEIENLSELPAAAVHLAWLAVGDQEGHNQYLQRRELGGKTTKQFRLIDMGQMFCDFNWSSATVVSIHKSYTLPAHMAGVLSLQKLRPAVGELKTVTDEAILSCFESCPEEWGVIDADQRAGAERVRGARDSIESILENGNPSIK